MKKNNSQEIGSQGEADTFEYIKELAKKMGFKLVKARRQNSGSQLGKDHLFEWQYEDKTYVWHFEVKSQKTKIVKKEILDKIYDSKKSGHKIDCWCLVAPHADPANNLDDAIADWNANSEFPFYIEVWSPATFISENIHKYSPELFQKIYGDTPPPTHDTDIADMKERITEISKKGKLISDNWPNDFEKKILNSRDDPSKILQNFQSMFITSKENTDFKLTNFEANEKGASASIIPRKGKKTSIYMEFHLTQDRKKEYEDFARRNRNEIFLTEDEVKKFSAKIGTTELGDHEKTRVHLKNVYPDFPEVKIVRHEGGKRYAGLQKIKFKFAGTEGDAIKLNNFDGNPSVKIAAEITQDSFSFKSSHADRSSPDYTIEDELGSLDFLEDLVTGKRFDVIKTENDELFFSGAFTSINIDVGATLDAASDYRKILKMIREIRDFSGKHINIPTKLTRDEYETIARLYKIITEKEIKVNLRGASFTVKDSKEVQYIVKEGLQEELAIEIRPFNEELFGTEIELGAAQMDHHNITVSKKKNSDGSITVTIDSLQEDSYTIIKFPEL